MNATLMIALLLSSPAIHSRQTAGSAADTIDYLGWKNCHRLANDRAELIVVPQIGRAAVFRLKDGPNAFWFDEKSGGRTRTVTDPYINFGGLYTWLAPEKHWSSTPQQAAGNGFFPPLDCLPHQVKQAGPRSVTIACRDEGKYNLTIEKTYRLDEKQPCFHYTVTLANHNAVPVRWSVWNLAGARAEGKVVFEAPGGVGSFKYIMNAEGSPEHYQAHTRFAGPLAVVDFAARGRRNNAYVPPAGRFCAHAMPDAWLVRTFPTPKPTELFTDNHSQIELWVDGDFREIEIVSPESKIEPGESLSWTETFTLVPTADLACPDHPDQFTAAVAELLDRCPSPPNAAP